MKPLKLELSPAKKPIDDILPFSISAHLLPIYRLAFFLNKTFGIELSKERELLFRGDGSTENYFSFYYFYDSHDFISYYLLSNKAIEEEEVILKNLPKMDYILLLKGIGVKRLFLRDPDCKITIKKRGEGIASVFSFSPIPLTKKPKESKEIKEAKEAKAKEDKETKEVEEIKETKEAKEIQWLLEDIQEHIEKSEQLRVSLQKKPIPKKES